MNVVLMIRALPAVVALNMFVGFAAVAEDANPSAGDQLLRRLDRIEAAISSSTPRTVRFNRDIRPILAEHCFKCHGPDEKQRKGDLRLDNADAAREALSPGKPDASEVIKRITTHDLDDRMPPAAVQTALSAQQIATLNAWIAEGAQYEPHWSFVKPERPEVPAIKLADWPRNPIDNFILARLESNGISPSPEADRRTLARRVHLDLIGLPPAPEAVETFVNDADSNAYEKLIDSLLASPHFGERWGRHWLDVARYADSDGYGIDAARPIYKYRDWVIDAFNADMPFDEFATKQLAGDQLPEATLSDQVATGFHRNTMINMEGGVDPEEFRIVSIIDRVNTTGTVFLGLTVGCAQCHTHKYDPISHAEYYQFYAFFNNDDEINIDLPTPDQEEQLHAARVLVDTAQRALDTYINAVEDYLLTDWEKALPADTRASFVASVQQGLTLPRAERHPDQTRAIRAIFFKDDPEYTWRTADVNEAQRKVPGVPSSMVLRKRAEPRETHIHLAGDFTRHGDKVAPATPAVLHALPANGPAPTRLDLAQWVVHPDNPLTARVTVNRFWQHLFGRGIVETENDFGTQGMLPTHSELLDWLATEFVAQGWSMKAMVRLILTSATYRQTSAMRPDLDEIDPLNKMLARQPRLRLDAEILRDSGLTASGLLNPAVGGPSVYPPQPDGIMSQQKVARAWAASEGPDRYRRGMYTFFWRASPHPSLILFDAPDAIQACTRRNRSNTPLQALTLLNEQSCVEQAKELAARLMSEPAADSARIARAFELCLARTPRESEMNTLLAMLEQERAVATNELDPWISLGRVMLNLDEFVTRE
ncbi:MAG: PSD1 and planctomycete cytochrome C domain-containing protein [Candidatus Hydrogenedentes bacterium]|nr:PSD1 and planctomycete cytochrome C domain-containing protein [Candidatus Hydrogenedentota bacterium]